MTYTAAVKRLIEARKILSEVYEELRRDVCFEPQQKIRDAFVPLEDALKLLKIKAFDERGAD